MLSYSFNHNTPACEAHSKQMQNGKLLFVLPFPESNQRPLLKSPKSSFDEADKTLSVMRTSHRTPSDFCIKSCVCSYWFLMDTCLVGEGLFWFEAHALRNLVMSIEELASGNKDVVEQNTVCLYKYVALLCAPSLPTGMNEYIILCIHPLLNHWNYV